MRIGRIDGASMLPCFRPERSCGRAVPTSKRLEAHDGRYASATDRGEYGRPSKPPGSSSLTENGGLPSGRLRRRKKEEQSPGAAATWTKTELISATQSDVVHAWRGFVFCNYFSVYTTDT